MALLNGKRVSIDRIRRSWVTIKTALEYVHLADFLLNAEHSEAIALLVFVFTRSSEWSAIAALGVASSIWCWICLPKEVPRMDQDEHDKPAALPVSAGFERPVVTLPTPDVPQNLIELVQQGIGVKIIIELKPRPR